MEERTFVRGFYMPDTLFSSFCLVHLVYLVKFSSFMHRKSLNVLHATQGIKNT